MRLPRFVFPLFLTSFIVGAPTLLLYTAGFHFNLKTFAIEQIGFLLVDGQPSNATVTLQGVEIGTKLPLYQKRLAPDSYNLSISSPDYFTYDTSVTIKPRESVVMSPVFLMKKSEPAELLSGPIGLLTRIPNNEHLLLYSIASSTPQLVLLDPEKKSSKLFTLPPDYYARGLSWLPRGDFVLLKSPLYNHLIDGKDQTFTLVPKDITEATLDEHGLVIGIRNKNLVSWNARTGVITTLSSKTPCAASLFVNNESIFCSSTFATVPGTYHVFKQGAYTTVCPAFTDSSQLVGITNENVGVFMVAFGNVLVKLHDQQALCSQTADGSRIDTHHDDAEIITSNGFDIVKRSTNSPLMRLGTSITSFTKILRTPYVAVAHDHQVTLINDTDRTMKPITILENVVASNLITNKAGTVLYFDRDDISNPGVFMLDLRDE